MKEPNTPTQGNMILDPENYHRMSAPFASADEANIALQAFAEGVRELRQKYRIADVLTVVRCTVTYSDGTTGAVLSLGNNGAMTETEGMAAYALGMAQAERREQINKLVSGHGTTRNIPK